MAIKKWREREEETNRWCYKYLSFVFFIINKRNYYSVSVCTDKLRCFSCWGWDLELNYDLDYGAWYESVESAMYAVESFIHKELKWIKR